MDDAAAQPDSRRNPTVLRFSPDVRLTAATGAGALVVAILAVVTGDPAGRLLLAGAALLLFAYLLTDLVFRPRLTATADGIELRAPTIRATLRWGEIESVGTHSRSHAGIRTTTLEVDAGARLAVFSRRSLGVRPEHAAALINALNPYAR